MNERRPIVREIWPHAKQVRWVHSLSAGVESLLFPELIESDVPLTNARGVFAESLVNCACGDAVLRQGSAQDGP